MRAVMIFADLLVKGSATSILMITVAGAHRGGCQQVGESASDRGGRQRIGRGEQCCREVDDSVPKVDISAVDAGGNMADIGSHDRDHGSHKSGDGQIFEL